MGLLELLTKIENAYINNQPNIKEMRKLVAGLGWTAEYEYCFTGRWLRWICFYDCEYILTRNDNDMRNYTA